MTVPHMVGPLGPLVRPAPSRRGGAPDQDTCANSIRVRVRAANWTRIPQDVLKERIRNVPLFPRDVLKERIRNAKNQHKVYAHMLVRLQKEVGKRAHAKGGRKMSDRLQTEGGRFTEESHSIFSLQKEVQVEVRFAEGGTGNTVLASGVVGTGTTQFSSRVVGTG